MPMGAPRPCSADPRCPKLVHGGGPCPAHARKRERERGTAHQRGYGARWRRYRLQFLREHPLCTLCSTETHPVPATVVDHIRDHKGDQDLFWDASNHRALCTPCHNARTDAGDFGR